jgi:Uncharacterized metal-binding protein
MVLDSFDIKISRENVLNLIDCFEDSPIYADVIAEYELILEQAYALLKPQAVLQLGDEKAPSIYAVQTVGEGISEYVTSLFNEGNYLGGMITNAMADDMLFQMEREIGLAVKEICKTKKKGVKVRVEAPQDIEMKEQRTIVDKTDSLRLIGVDATESYMLTPVKSTAYIYILDDDETMMNTEHNCDTCSNLECKSRNRKPIKLTVINRGEQKSFDMTSGTMLLEMLQEAGYYLPAICNGKGTCGKCKVRIMRGNVSISREDEAFFDQRELDLGYRLACVARPRFDCIVEILGHKDSKIDVLVAADIATDGIDDLATPKATKDTDECGVIIDIGTTTIAMQLVSLESGKVLQTFTTVNKQRAYGADVISRIEASVKGKKEALRKSIQKDILTGINELVSTNTEKISKVIIGANATMVHLLMGYNCNNLGTYPFTPVNIDTINIGISDLLDDNIGDARVTICSGISTYVGGDIVSGLYALGFDKKEKVSILIDLGTNGEMAIGNKDKILVTSTAAGPAFEGGNIACGVASVSGAICGVTINEGKANTTTIGGESAVGICGTGVIEAVAELLREGLIDETGLFEEEYFDEGFLLCVDEKGSKIALKQKDIREIQLAKSAVRAGVETLISQYGVTYDEIENVYIAGGFGYKMSIDKALSIGLLPQELRDKIKAVGNTCLSGAYKYLLKGDSEQDVDNIISLSSEVQLSSDKKFNELYVKYMYFD